MTLRSVRRCLVLLGLAAGLAACAPAATPQAGTAAPAPSPHPAEVVQTQVAEQPIASTAAPLTGLPANAPLRSTMCR